MISGKFGVTAALLLLTALTPAGAGAQDPPPSAVSRADALFEEGRGLLEEGKLPEACDRLAESDRLDPSVGTLGLLASCHEKRGMLATAWREYVATAERADKTGDERAAFARSQAAGLDPRLPRLAIRLARVGQDVEVLLDGERIPSDQIGVDLRLNPGPHEVLARAPGKPEFRVKVTARESAREVIEVPDLQPPAPAPAKTPPPITPAAPDREPGDPRTPAGFIVGGAGLVGLGIGLAFGASALGKNSASSRIQATCASAVQCNEGRVLREQAQAEATASTIGFVAAAAGLGAGAILLITSRGSSDRQAQARHRAVSFVPAAGPQGGGALLKGSF